MTDFWCIVNIAAGIKFSNEFLAAFFTWVMKLEPAQMLQRADP